MFVFIYYFFKRAPYIRRINYYNFRVKILSLCARLMNINSEVRYSHELVYEARHCAREIGIRDVNYFDG